MSTVALVRSQQPSPPGAEFANTYHALGIQLPSLQPSKTCDDLKKFAQANRWIWKLFLVLGPHLSSWLVEKVPAIPGALYFQRVGFMWADCRHRWSLEVHCNASNYIFTQLVRPGGVHGNVRWRYTLEVHGNASNYKRQIQTQAHKQQTANTNNLSHLVARVGGVHCCPCL